jgi:hypothetical protein
MVIFRVGYTEPFRSRLGVVGPGDYLDDFDDDEVSNQDIYIAKYYADNTYVVALAEVDEDNDLTDNNGKYASLLWAQTQLTWQVYMTALEGASLTGNGPWLPSHAAADRRS